MAQRTLAPWAEPVPGMDRLLTVDEFMALPDDGWQYELVEGRVVRLPPGKGSNSNRAVRLIAALQYFVEERGLGEVTAGDGGYEISRPGERPTVLAPDAAFMRVDRVPSHSSPAYDRYWRGAPDLLAEIVSPGQHQPEMAAKAQTYLEASARLVWIIWPRQQRVDVWQPGSDQPVASLGPADVLDGLDVLPGFTFPVARLFQ